MGKYVSRAQIRWAFATHQTWAKRWADHDKRESGKRVWEERLPDRKSIRTR